MFQTLQRPTGIASRQDNARSTIAKHFIRLHKLQYEARKASRLLIPRLRLLSLVLDPTSVRQNAPVSWNNSKSGANHPSNPTGEGRDSLEITGLLWLRDLDLNQKPSGYEPEMRANTTT
jgi:hypothetical protein